jgi:hypothetical protein
MAAGNCADSIIADRRRHAKTDCMTKQELDAALDAQTQKLALRIGGMFAFGCAAFVALYHFMP